MASAKKRSCKTSPDSFCYVCGEYIGPKQVKHNIIFGSKLCQAYDAYFGVKVGDQDKTWAPHVCCGSCRSNLEGWFRGTRSAMPFAIPRIWREPQNHYDDCYFCLVDLSKFKSAKNRKKIAYPSIPSSIAPVKHSDELPVPQFDVPKEASSSEEQSSEDSNYVCEATAEPHFPNQSELDDLIRDLGLTKSNAELLTSRLQEWNLLDPTCRSSKYRKRHKTFASFYIKEGDLCYCNDIDGLMSEPRP